MTNDLKAPWMIRVDGRIINTDNRAIGHFLDVPAGQLAVSLVNEALTQTEPVTRNGMPVLVIEALRAWIRAQDERRPVKEARERVFAVAQEWLVKHPS